jgi:hypothetical protein
MRAEKPRNKETSFFLTDKQHKEQGMNWRPQNDPPLDEEEIEITDVPAQEMPREKGGPLPSIQRLSLRTQRSLREQRWRVIRLSGLVLLAVMLLLASTPAVRQLALATLFPLHPSTPIRPLSGPGLFYLHTLPISLDALPADPRIDLIHTTQLLLDSLQSTTLVQPGERYVTTQSGVQQAKEPLSATLHFQLETQTSHPAICTGVTLGHSCMIAQQDCRRFCTLQWVRATQGWDVAAIVRASWDYTTLTGQGLARMQPDTTMRPGELQFVTFHITWQQSRWHVTFHPAGDSSFDNPVCSTTLSEIATNPATDSSRNPDLTWNFVSGALNAAGCLAEATLGQEAVSSSEHAYLLHRFGLLIAANPLAHQRWPELPAATKQEQEIVRQIEAGAARRGI